MNPTNKSDNATDPGPQYTKGDSFRAQAETRQRQYRAEILKVPWEKHGHWLSEEGISQGANFITTEAFEAAKERDQTGKGVGSRTFQNMLSSQAMCFNIFAPLANNMPLAVQVLKRFIPWLKRVDAIHIEYTPSNECFGDQTGRGGVDCDVLIEGTTDNDEDAIIVLETKFVEPEFSVCSFTQKKRLKEGKPYCAGDVPIIGDTGICLYEKEKGYKYWQRTAEFSTLSTDKMPANRCPFSGSLWQLWVNHVLAHAEAGERHATRALFGVVAPEANSALHTNHQVFNEFTNLLSSPESFVFIGVEALINAIHGKRQ